MKNLEFDFLASTYLLSALGWELQPVKHSKFHHPTQPDETFGTCNNWENDKFSVPLDNIVYNDKNNTDRTPRYVNAHLLKYMTPYDSYIYKCTHAMYDGTPLESLTRVFTGIKNEFIYKVVHHIRNFRVSREEMKRAKNMCQDRKFNLVNLEHLKLRSKKLL